MCKMKNSYRNHSIPKGLSKTLNSQVRKKTLTKYAIESIIKA